MLTFSTLKSIITFALILGFSNLSWAFDAIREIRLAQKKCPNLTCTSSTIQKQLISERQWRTFQRTERQKFQKMARRIVAETWPDTILESDYVIKGPSRLDEVHFIKKADQLLGYWIKYSVQAWDISNCNYDFIHSKDLSKCKKGRIVEGSFVDLTISTFEIDSYWIATFNDQ